MTDDGFSKSQIRRFEVMGIQYKCPTCLIEFETNSTNTPAPKCECGAIMTIKY